MATLAQQAYIAKLYVGYFGRLMDNEGLNYWSGELDKRGMDAVANGIYAGAKGSDQSIWGMGNQAYVEQVYLNVLNRAGDAGGVAYWTGELAKGVGRDVVVQRILDATNNPGNEADKARLENMGTVALYFANNYESTKSASPLETKNAVTADPATVEVAKKMVDGTHGGTKPPEETAQNVMLNDSSVQYDLKGGSKDDVFNVEAFKTGSKIDGGTGSDTLDFRLYENAKAGVTANLTAGTVSIDGKNMSVQWVENIIGTANDDTLTGDRNNNIIKMGGGADKVDAGIGDDVIVAASMANVVASTATDKGINGGTGIDILRIVDADINLTTTGLDMDMIRNIEVLQVGYVKGDESKPAAATITVDSTVDLTQFKKIMANPTPATDRKGAELPDTIKSTEEDLDLRGVELIGFERVEVSLADGTITIGAATFTKVKEVVGVIDAAGDPTTELALVGKDDDTFDLRMPKFVGIATLAAPVDSAGIPIKATIIVNQSLLNDLEFEGDFSNATLELSGRAIDMTDATLPTGDEAFNTIKYGVAVDMIVTADQIAKGAFAGTTIIGSAGQFDSFTVEGDGDPEGNGVVDMTGISLEGIEELILNDVTEATLTDDVLADIINIAGDATTRTSLINGNVAPTLPAGAPIPPLDLTGTKLRDIFGLGTEDDPGEFLFDLGTVFGAIPAENGAGVSSTPLQAIWGTVILDEAGSYDFSGIKEGDATIEGSDGNDYITGSAKVAMTLKGGEGNDTLIAGEAGDNLDGGQGNDVLKGNKGDDTLEGGEGNDTLEGGDGNDNLTGGKGQDIMTGGKGLDEFNFTTGDSGTTESTVDVITDFKIGEDTLNFTFLTDSAIVPKVDGSDPFIKNFAAAYADKATLSAAATAALSDLLKANAGAAEGDVLVAQFTYGGKMYAAVDAYPVNASGDATVTVDFLVQLQGVTGTLTADELNISADLLPIA